jgi:hypothetical protein
VPVPTQEEEVPTFASIDAAAPHAPPQRMDSDDWNSTTVSITSTPSPSHHTPSPFPAEQHQQEQLYTIFTTTKAPPPHVSNTNTTTLSSLSVSSIPPPQSTSSFGRDDHVLDFHHPPLLSTPPPSLLLPQLQPTRYSFHIYPPLGINELLVEKEHEICRCHLIMRSLQNENALLREGCSRAMYMVHKRMTTDVEQKSSNLHI